MTIIQLVALGAATCLAQDHAEDDGPEMSRAEWQAQLRASPERANLMWRERKGSYVDQLPTPDEIAEEASRRVLQNSGLATSFRPDMACFDSRADRIVSANRMILCQSIDGPFGCHNVADRATNVSMRRRIEVAQIGEVGAMIGDQKSRMILLAVLLPVLLAATGLLPTQASAITLEVAKKCNALVAKQFPPRQPANPAAGSAKGSGQQERDFFKKCVESDGKMEGAADKNEK